MLFSFPFKFNPSCWGGDTGKMLPVTGTGTAKHLPGLAKVRSKHTCSFMLYMQACTLVKANKGTPI